jgi:hypothetical protein
VYVTVSVDTKTNHIHTIILDHFFDREWLARRRLILMSIPDKLVFLD